jgi:hypothetical protein
MTKITLALNVRVSRCPHHEVMPLALRCCIWRLRPTTAALFLVHHRQRRVLHHERLVLNFRMARKHFEFAGTCKDPCMSNKGTNSSLFVTRPIISCIAEFPSCP